MISLAVLAYLVLVALFIFFLWRWTQYKEGRFAQKDPHDYESSFPFPSQPGAEMFEGPRKDKLDVCTGTVTNIDQQTGVHHNMRLVSHNRFMPKDHDLERSVAMADQILEDQQKAHEEPGEVVHAPAPGEPGYEPPEAIVAVTVDKFTVHMQRGHPTNLSERSAAGAETMVYSIPNEWAEVVTALAFEVKRLREGWSVTE